MSISAKIINYRLSSIESFFGINNAVTITPADSNIGVTLNVEAFYKAHEDGASMDEVVSKASDTVIRGFDNQSYGIFFVE